MRRIKCTALQSSGVTTTREAMEMTKAESAQDYNKMNLNNSLDGMAE